MLQSQTHQSLAPEQIASEHNHLIHDIPHNPESVIQSNSAEMTVNDSIQSNPETTLESPVSSSLSAKLDGLVTVMTQFIQLQMLKEPQQTVSSSSVGKHKLTRPPESSEPPVTQTVLTPTTPQSPNKTGHDDQVIHAAIDAIIAHNNRQPLHDLKWEITINTLKAFSRNQRAIERILGRGKDNPLVARIIGTREDEIANHHQLHHILPGHNHRHKRHRKIADVLSNGDSLE